MPGTPWWPTKQIWRQLCTSCRYMHMQSWACKERLTAPKSFTCIKSAPCSVQSCSLAGIIQRCSEPQALKHSCSQSTSQFVRLDLQARLDSQAAAVDAAKGHQAQIWEAQVAADELVTHAQQSQREAQREAVSWRAQVLFAATCTNAA